MNFRNKYLVITLRTLLGLMFLFSGIAGLMMGNSTENIPENMIATTQMLWETGIFHMIKVTEIVAGLMLLVGFLPALATIFVAPIGVGIVIVNARLAPSSLPLGIIICLVIAYLGYVYWDKYKAMFKR